MDLSEPSPPVVAGGLVLLALAFAVREVVGGRLRAAWGGPVGMGEAEGGAVTARHPSCVPVAGRDAPCSTNATGAVR